MSLGALIAAATLLLIAGGYLVWEMAQYDPQAPAILREGWRPRR